MSGDRTQDLQPDLDTLAASAALIDPASPVEVAELARELNQWLVGAAPALPAWDAVRASVESVQLGLPQGLASTLAYQQLIDSLALAQGLLGGAPTQAPASEHLVQGVDRESWQDFLLECPELLGRVEEQLLASLRNEAFDANAVLRPLHTLKGICGMLGLEAQAKLMHLCEDVLQPHKGSAELPAPTAQALLAAMDSLRNQCDCVSAGLAQGRFRVLDVSAPTEHLRALDGNAPASPAEPGAEDLHAAASELEVGTRAADNVIRIPVSKMDALMETVGELAICQAQVTAEVRAQDLKGLLAAEAGRLEKISRQLQETVLGLRMVPVQPLFNRISRQAFDLSQRMGKPLQVEIFGGETEIDKSLIEDLFEPLLHLVRNALDHGMDSPIERQAAGKPAQGLLRLAAYHQGGDFVLQMADDGRGFDLEAIAAKCRAQGRLKPGEEASADRLIDELFRPGFSTAAALTDLSGRGIGLDAVRRKMMQLKGSVSASHVAGRGATFTLRLPLTLALLDAILVRAQGERYALPAAQVLRFVAWDKQARHSVSGGEAWMETSGRSLALVDLGAAQGERAVALHVSVAGLEACLVVDEVLGKQQVVVKALGGLLHDLPGVSGGAVLADGRVGLILDLESLLKARAIA